MCETVIFWQISNEAGNWVQNAIKSDKITRLDSDYGIRLWNQTRVSWMFLIKAGVWDQWDVSEALCCFCSLEDLRINTVVCSLPPHWLAEFVKREVGFLARWKALERLPTHTSRCSAVLWNNEVRRSLRGDASASLRHIYSVPDTHSSFFSIHLPSVTENSFTHHSALTHCTSTGWLVACISLAS